MTKYFTLEYWQDDGWFVGRMKEIPGIFSQGETLKELQKNIADAYHGMLDSELDTAHEGAATMEIGVEL